MWLLFEFYLSTDIDNITEYKVGDSYTVNGDTEIKALWENSVITPTTYATRNFP